MKSTWINSKWSASDLDGESVEFRLHPDMPVLVGKFMVYGNDGDEIAVEIIWETPTSPSSWIQHRYVIESSIDNLLQEHPDQSVAHYRLICCSQ